MKTEFMFTFSEEEVELLDDALENYWLAYEGGMFPQDQEYLKWKAERVKKIKELKEKICIPKLERSV